MVKACAEGSTRTGRNTYLCASKIPMKFFIDTASLAQIKEAQDLGVLDGVTTNPSLMAKEGISGTDAVMKHYVDICTIVEGDVSAEVIATDYATAWSEGRRGSGGLAPTDRGESAHDPRRCESDQVLHGKGIKTNCTLGVQRGSSPCWRPRPGATYVSPFIGRLDDVSTDGVELIDQIRTIYDNYGYGTEILAASIRHPDAHHPVC
jgi:transaldolase